MSQSNLVLVCYIKDMGFKICSNDSNLILTLSYIKVIHIIVSQMSAKGLYALLGPISSMSLRRVFVLKTSYEVRTLKIGFHQTIELCELLTFFRIFKTNI